MEKNMKDILKDLVAHSHSLGFIDCIKITGTDNATVIEAISERAVIIQGETIKPATELKGKFGMPNLNKLDLHLKNPEYKDNAKINLEWGIRNGENRPVSIVFENNTGDFKNEYKLMSSEMADTKVASVKFNGTNWNIDFEPSVTAIARLKLQAAAHSEETVFTVKTDKDCLNIFFGDANSHEGNFTFQSGITGKLRQTWMYPVSHFISVLNLDGDKTIKFSDDGVALITINSGLAKYNYYFPSQTK